MNNIRCTGCNKLLLKGRFIEIEIKCPRCGKINNLRASEHPVKTGENNEIVSISHCSK